MPRPQAHHGQQRLLLGIAVGVILLHSIAPAGWISWLGWFGNRVEMLVTPVQQPVEWVGHWLMGRGKQRTSDSPELDEARREAERWKTMFLQALEENSELRRIAQALRAGGELHTGIEVATIIAPVLGQARGSNILKVRHGSNKGVAAGDVVAYDGVHLLGTVAADVDPLFCRVIPIIDRAAGGTNGTIIPGETRVSLPPDPAAERLICRLAPVGDGTLSGDVAYSGSRPDRPPLTVDVGSIVRLADGRWPATAQMLVLGKVIRVENKANHRVVIVVEPFYQLDAIREVYIRIPEERARLGAGAGGSPP